MLNKNTNHFESTKIKSNESQQTVCCHMSHTSNLLGVTVQMLVTVQKNAIVLVERYLHLLSLLQKEISVNMTSPN